MLFGQHQFEVQRSDFLPYREHFLHFCADWKHHVYELSVPTYRERDIWRLPRGNDFKSSADVHLNSKWNQLESGGQRSLVEDVTETSPLTSFWCAAAHNPLQTRPWFLLGWERTPQSQPLRRVMSARNTTSGSSVHSQPSVLQRGSAALPPPPPACCGCDCRWEERGRASPPLAGTAALAL